MMRIVKDVMRPCKDYTLKRFGKIVVLSFHHQNKNRRYWLCQCDCGNQKVLRTDCLKKSGIKSCGCSRRGRNNIRWKGCGDISKSVITGIKSNADKSGISFNLTLKYLWDIYKKQCKRCALTNDSISFGVNFRDYANKTASLDRIDSTKGYVKGNVQWVHKDVNFSKQSMSQQQFINMCKKVTQTFESKK